MRLITTLIGMIICQLTFGQTPSLSIQDTENKKDLEISQLKVSVIVVGNIATTTFDVVFYNSFSRDLEGELVMPLSDGQEICRYALEINGKLREGVIVEKIKARQTFEAVVRQNIDPGIANITKGNFFKTRIFPIPANGNKRIVLAISETLSGDDKNLYYSLPFDPSKKIGEFKLEVKVFKNNSEDKEIISEFENIKFDSKDNAYCLNFDRKDFSSNSPLNFIIPRSTTTDHQLYTCEFDSKTYFYLITKTPTLKTIPKKYPQKITVYWDNSFSAYKRNMNKELDFLNKYLISLKGKKDVTLISFNHKTNPPKIFSIGQDPIKLINYIKQLPNDGATRFDQIIIDEKCDEILMFSDAINTIGEEQIMTSFIPMYTIASSNGSNYSLLKRIATESSGDFIDLNRITLEKALKIMQKNEDKFLSYNYNKSEIEEVFPDYPCRVNEYFEIVGILKSEKATLNVNYGHIGLITNTQSYEICKNSDIHISRIWAEKKIESLELNYSKNQDEIFQLGQKFKIVTPNTAFIVLDRVEDYVEHKIVPPDELKEEYNKLLAKYEKNQELTPKAIEEKNIARIEKLKSWYINPIKTSSKNKIESNDNRDIFFSLEEAEDVIPITRQEEMDPPPPPPPVRIVNGITIVNDDVEIIEEFEFESSELYDMPPRKSSSKSSIKVLAWLPDAPYMEVLRNASNQNMDSLYFTLNEENINSQSF